MKAAVGPFRIVRPIGEGGMGVVYEAVDDRLGRKVALKTLLAAAEDPRARDRLRREARVAASVNHPNVCQVYEVGEDAGELYVAMELLEGEPLSARIARGPMPANEALRVALGVLGALEAIHARGLVHRDLKPSNVFLTPHGVKVLDFGLALGVDEKTSSTEERLTLTGMVVGTPQYMAPEQWTKQGIGPPSDLFALSSMLFEMLTGRAPFQGRNPMEIYHAIAYEPPPPLSGGSEPLDRLIQAALAKDPRDRPASAAAMAQAVRDAIAQVGDASIAVVRAVTRVMILPFRVLRPDPDVELVAAGLPDAITTSISGLPSIVVRSNRGVSLGPSGEPDLAAIAAQAQVDVVLVGTLLRAGDRVRVTSQLLETPAATVLWSERADLPFGDLFEFQDALTAKLVESLAPKLPSTRGGPRRGVPATAHAYELYVRANQIAHTTDQLPQARELYLQCVSEDPTFAPAWARLGRAHRVLAKYGLVPASEGYAKAGQAFTKALSLDPDLPLAHSLYTYYEVEEMGHARDAMVRLLGQVQRRAADADLWSALVVALRFGGLLAPSSAAHARARRLDPSVRTSVAFTYWMAAEYEKAIEIDDQDMRWLTVYSLPMMGKEAEAVAAIDESRASRPRGFSNAMLLALKAGIQRDREACLLHSKRVDDGGFHDPEGLYYAARNLSRAGADAEAMPLLERAVRGGFHVPVVMARDPWLDSLRGTPGFEALRREAEEGHRASVEAYRKAGGERLVGPIE